MINLSHSLRRTVRGALGLHVTRSDLLAYRDRELRLFGRLWVGNHLNHCNVCQRQADLITKDVQTFARMDRLQHAREYLDLPKGLRNLQQAITDWEARRILDGETPARVLGALALQQLTDEFELYLGNGATAALLGKIPGWESERQDVLVEAESLLREFLGRNAAAATIRRISQSQRLFEKSIQGSLPA